MCSRIQVAKITSVGSRLRNKSGMEKIYLIDKNIFVLEGNYYSSYIIYCPRSPLPRAPCWVCSLSLSAERRGTMGRMMQFTSLVCGSTNWPLSNVPQPKGMIRGSIQCFTSCNTNFKTSSFNKHPGFVQQQIATIENRGSPGD